MTIKPLKNIIIIHTCIRNLQFDDDEIMIYVGMNETILHITTN